MSYENHEYANLFPMMSDDEFKALSEYYPLITQEELVYYFNKLKETKNSEITACYLVELHNEYTKRKKKRQKQKNKWIQKARKKTEFLKQQKCFVCDKYQELTQLHHLYPLHLQFDNEVSSPVLEHVWLCPTHHVLVHKRIDAVLKKPPEKFEIEDLTIAEDKAISNIVQSAIYFQKPDSELSQKFLNSFLFEVKIANEYHLHA